MFNNNVKINKFVVCSKCGTKFDYEAQFCDKCGSNIEKQKVIDEQKSSKHADINPNSLKMKIQGQIQIIAVIEIAFGIVGLLSSVFLAVISPFIPDMIKSAPQPPVVYSTSLMNFILVLAAFIAIIIFIISTTTIFIGYKLYQLDSIGRLGTMIISSFALLMVPFGTIFGIVSLVLLTKPSVIELFNKKIINPI